MTTDRAWPGAASGTPHASEDLSPLSADERRVFGFVAERLTGAGCAPSLREIVVACGLSGPSAASRVIDRLEGRLLLERRAGAVRGLSLTEAGHRLMSTGSSAELLLALLLTRRLEERNVPLLCRVAALAPDLDATAELLHLTQLRIAQLRTLDSAVERHLTEHGPLPGPLQELLGEFDRLTVELGAAITSWPEYLEYELDQCLGLERMRQDAAMRSSVLAGPAGALEGNLRNVRYSIEFATSARERRRSSVGAAAHDLEIERYRRHLDAYHTATATLLERRDEVLGLLRSA